MNAIFIIARVLFVLLFLGSAFGHIAQAEAMAGYAKYKGAPGGKAGVILSGVALGIGALSVLLGIYGDLGALLIAATLVPITFFMHAFWKESDAQAKQTEQIAFNKNLALIGGALAFFLLYAVSSPLGASITGSFFHLS